MITEPQRSDLKTFIAQADTVLLVKVLAGDVESYENAVYKAKVVSAYTGSPKAGDVIYFGRFIGTRIGNQYLLFLKNPLPEPMSHSGPAIFGEVRPYRVMREGYGQMEIAYSCGFSKSESCDDSIRVCTDYVVLPKHTPVSDEHDKSESFGCRWFRKDSVIALLHLSI